MGALLNKTQISIIHKTISVQVRRRDQTDVLQVSKRYYNFLGKNKYNE